MTISTSVNSNAYTGNGSAVAYDYTFTAFRDSTVVVKLNGVTQSTGYTITRNTNNVGGTITFNSPPALGASVLIKRVLPLTQNLDLIRFGRFPAESVEQALDEGIMIDQQLSETIDEGLADVNESIEAILREIAALSGELPASVLHTVPPLNGDTIELPYAVNNVTVYLNGRLLTPNYTLSGSTLVLPFSVTTEDEVIVFLNGQPRVGQEQNLIQVYPTVADMVTEFHSSGFSHCMTLAYNRPVVTHWTKTTVGAGDLSDATLALNGGTFAKMEIRSQTDVRAFGAWGDQDPDSDVLIHDDSDAIINCIKNARRPVSTYGDNFAVTKHIPIWYGSGKVVDFRNSGFFWFGSSDAIRQVSRDRGMFEIVGEFTGQFATSGPWNQWLEGAETFPADDTTPILEREFMLLVVGSLPDGPSEAYMVRPMPVNPNVSDPNIRFQTDYRLGWTHGDATFRYFGVNPAKNIELHLGHVEDKTTYEYYETDGSGNNRNASAVVMEAAWDCHVSIKTSKNFQYPTVMTYYTTDCSVEGTFLLPSERISPATEGGPDIVGWGIVVQWNNALRPRSYNLSAQGNRRVLDYTQATYAYAENIGGESTRDGEMTTHGSYEHNLTYVNTRGFMSFANSGVEFGESTKDVTVIHHHGSDVFAVTNTQNLHLQDVRCNSIRVNSVGLKMSNVSLYDLETSVDNLCQINNWSARIGKPYPKDEANAVIENSTLGSNGKVFLVDEDIPSDETITFANSKIFLRQGDFAGPANIVFDNCDIRPKNGTGQLVLVANPTSIRFDNCNGWNVAFGVQDDVVTPVKLQFLGGTWVGEAFPSAFWANEDGKNGGTVTGNYFKMHNVTVEWDNNTSSGLFYDPLQTRNPNWYTKITLCDFTGKNGEEIRIPKLRGVMRFNTNTLDNVTRNFDTLDATYEDESTMVL